MPNFLLNGGVFLTQAVDKAVPYVSTEEFITRITKAIVIAINALGGVIMPIATLGLLASILVFAVGSLTHSKTIKKIGAAGLAAAAGSVLMYFAAPLIMGIIRSMGEQLMN